MPGRLWLTFSIYKQSVCIISFLTGCHISVINTVFNAMGAQGENPLILCTGNNCVTFLLNGLPWHITLLLIRHAIQNLFWYFCQKMWMNSVWQNVWKYLLNFAKTIEKFCKTVELNSSGNDSIKTSLLSPDLRISMECSEF